MRGEERLCSVEIVEKNWKTEVCSVEIAVQN